MIFRKKNDKLNNLNESMDSYKTKYELIEN